jgi:hypothetical protein
MFSERWAVSKLLPFLFSGNQAYLPLMLDCDEDTFYIVYFRLFAGPRHEIN